MTESYHTDAPASSPPTQLPPKRCPRHEWHTLILDADAMTAYIGDPFIYSYSQFRRCAKCKAIGIYYRGSRRVGRLTDTQTDAYGILDDLAQWETHKAKVAGSEAAE